MAGRVGMMNISKNPVIKEAVSGGNEFITYGGQFYSPGNYFYDLNVYYQKFY